MSIYLITFAWQTLIYAVIFDSNEDSEKWTFFIQIGIEEIDIKLGQNAIGYES